MTDNHIPDSEEEDSDYVQDEKADDDDDDGGEEEPEDTLGTGISAQKRSKIDELWTSMNADDSAVIRRNDGRAPEKKTKGKKGKIKASKKANKVLAGIFGKKTASSLVSKAISSKRRPVGKEAAARSKELAASRTIEISEVKKYAGKDIVVKRTVTAGSAKKAATAAAKQKKAGIDNVLAAIDGPKAISTVTKSSLDWEKYKAEEGIEGDMQQATKDGKGYLNKQDFLQRCDVRKFENELEARQAKRSNI